MSELLTQTVTVRGTTYKVRELKGVERYKCIDIQEKEGTAGMAGFILKRCIVEPEKVDWDNLPTQVVEKLVNAITRLSDMGEDALEDAEKKIRGNFELIVWHRLAGYLGHRSLHDCMEAVSSSEFNRWLAFYRLFPYDDGFAEIAATLCNIHRDRKKHPEGFTRADFLPGWKEAPVEDGGENLFNMLRLRAKKNG